MEVTATEPSARVLPFTWTWRTRSQQFGFDLCWQRQGYTGCHPAIRSTPAENPANATSWLLRLRSASACTSKDRRSSSVSSSPNREADCWSTQPGRFPLPVSPGRVYHRAGIAGNQACHRERRQCHEECHYQVHGKTQQTCAQRSPRLAHFASSRSQELRPAAVLGCSGLGRSPLQACVPIVRFPAGDVKPRHVPGAASAQSPGESLSDLQVTFFKKGGRDLLVSWHQAGSKCLRSASTARCCNTLIAFTERCMIWAASSRESSWVNRSARTCCWSAVSFVMAARTRW